MTRTFVVTMSGICCDRQIFAQNFTQAILSSERDVCRLRYYPSRYTQNALKEAQKQWSFSVKRANKHSSPFLLIGKKQHLSLIRYQIGHNFMLFPLYYSIGNGQESVVHSHLIENAN